jgi:hypothetical protein
MGRALPLLVASLAAAPSAWSAIAGLPEPPTPRPLPGFWLAVNDDLFGDAIIDNDDYRTGNLNVGVAYGLLVAAADYSAFTKRNDIGYANGTRTDELTATLGLRLGELLPDAWRARTELIVGGGVRIDGDLGGENAQNAIHGYFGFPQAHLAYDRERAETDGLGFLYGRYVLLRMGAADARQRTIELQAEGAAAGTTGGERQAYLGATLAWIGRQGTAWVGSRVQWNEGVDASPTAALVAEHERGVWLTAGLAKKDSLYLSAAYNWQTHAITGALGLAFGSATQEPAVPHLDAIDHDLAPTLPEVTNQSLQYFPGSSALGLQVRGPCLASWSQPEHDRGLGFEWLIDYQFGRVPGYATWTGNEVDADQLVGGLAAEYTLTTPWRYGVQVQPFVYAGAGVRIERVKVTEPVHRFDQTTGTAGAGQGGGGLRARLYSRDGGWFTRLWFGIGYDAWLPFASRRIDQGGDHDRHLVPGGARQYSVGFSTFW